MSSFDYSKLSLVLDLGSSRIRGFIGYEENGNICHVASEEVNSAGIKEGFVENLQNAAGCLKGLLTRLQNNLKTKFLKDYPLEENQKFRFGKVYVGLSVARLQGAYVDITRNLAHEEITPELMASMMEDARKTAIKYEKQDLISTNMVSACVDGEWVNDAEGRVCDTLVVTYHNVYVHHDAVLNLRMCLRKVGLNDVEIIPSVKAVSNIVMDGDNKVGKVVIVNLGAQVTSISAYENGDFRYVYESSIGSDKVTKDLETLGIPTEVAEVIKKNCNAAVNMQEPYIFSVRGYNNQFESEVIESIIEDRMTKIIGKIELAIKQVFPIEQVQKILLVGSGAKQRFLPELMEEKLGCCVEYATINGKKLSGSAVILGLFTMAKGGSILIEDVPVVVEPSGKGPTEKDNTSGTGGGKKGGPFSGIKDKVNYFFGNLFTETENPEANDSKTE